MRVASNRSITFGQLVLSALPGLSGDAVITSPSAAHVPITSPLPICLGFASLWASASYIGSFLTAWVRFGPILAKFGPNSTSFARSRPNSIDICRMRAKFGQRSAEVDHISARFGDRAGPVLAIFGRKWPHLGQTWQSWTGVEAAPRLSSSSWRTNRGLLGLFPGGVVAKKMTDVSPHSVDGRRMCAKLGGTTHGPSVGRSCPDRARVGQTRANFSLGHIRPSAPKIGNSRADRQRGRERRIGAHAWHVSTANGRHMGDTGSTR